MLHEIHATGGDVRRISDLFGPGVGAATRYTRVVDLLPDPALDPLPGPVRLLPLTRTAPRLLVRSDVERGQLGGRAGHDLAYWPGVFEAFARC